MENENVNKNSNSNTNENINKTQVTVQTIVQTSAAMAFGFIGYITYDISNGIKELSQQIATVIAQVAGHSSELDFRRGILLEHRGLIERNALGVHENKLKIKQIEKELDKKK